MLKRIFIYLIWGIAVCYLIFAFIIVPCIPDDSMCKGVLVTVANDENGNLTSENIMEMLSEEGLDPHKRRIDDVNTHSIEKFLNGITLVKECQVYKGTTGYVNIEIECKIPILKVHEHDGRSYYIDSEGDTITGIHKALHLPVASGHITNEMRKDELRKIACAIYDSSFWRAQVEQIYFNSIGEIIIVPRVGDHIIEFGTVDNAAEKLDKLYTFYTRGLNNIGWGKYEKLNIEFNDKVIGTKKIKQNI